MTTDRSLPTGAEPVDQPVTRLARDAAVRTLTVDALLTRTLHRVHTLVHVWRSRREEERGRGGEEEVGVFCGTSSWLFPREEVLVVMATRRPSRQGAAASSSPVHLFPLSR